MTIEQFDTDSAVGLTDHQVDRRRALYGRNQMQTHKARSIFSLIANQFKSPLIWLLVVALVIAFVLGEFVDGSIILFVLLFNTCLGTYQESRAQTTFLSLSKLTTTQIVVRRNGEKKLISSEDLVPGDIVELHPGDKIPADIRLIESQGMFLNESVLTGESFAVEKDYTGAVDQAQPYESTSLVWAGTHIEKGTGLGVVHATGTQTRMGMLAGEIADTDREVPLQQRVKKLARILVIIGVIALIVLFGIGIVAGRDIIELTRIAIALLVAVVPEGLPVVMTLILSAGVYRMSKKQVLVKRLEAIETLGHARIIATDKTGTITRNEMTVSDIWVSGHTYHVSGVGYIPKGDIEPRGVTRDFVPALDRLVAMAERSTHAQLIYDGDHTKIIGDPTEAAMRVLGMKRGIDQEVLRKETPLVSELEFDFRKKYYGMNFDLGQGQYEMVVIGAGEVLLNHATQWLDEAGNVQGLDAKGRTDIHNRITEYSHQGLRVIGVAYKKISTTTFTHDDVEDLIFVGLMAMKDAVRESVPNALQAARDAGMRVVMITGDHVTTATSLAIDAGIFRDGDTVLSGPEINTLSIEELAERITSVTVFARITPADKMKIIHAYQHNGDTIAMTGDGVNDVGSIAAADLGIAMGITGTEAAKEAADIILLRDDFGDIPLAVAEGRNIVLAMKRVILFLLATNIAELLIIMIAVVFGFPAPLTPAQIMWMNVVSDSFIVIALGLQVAAPEVLRTMDYERISKKFIDRYDMGRMVFRVIVMTTGPLGIFFLSQWLTGDYASSTTLALLTLILVQIFNAWYMTKQTKGVMQDNRLFVMSLVALGLFGILFVVPGLSEIFGVALQAPWMLILVVAFAGVVMFDGLVKER